jgi:hypothetical protein
MRCIHGRKATLLILIGTLAHPIGLRLAFAQSESAPKATLGEAEITANDVYVRSGDSLNHYTIIKLKAGDRVTVVGERGEWFEILPPEGTFSLVSGDYVDSTDDQKGVINGANVRVRAGSLLNENKYTVQTLLSKGAEVTILGRNPDGFLRIKPPAGATLWINKSFANLNSGGAPAVPTTSPVTITTNATPTDAPQLGTVTTVVASETETAGSPTQPSAPPMPSKARATSAEFEAQQRKLSEIDAAVIREYAKPATDRNFDVYTSQYRSVMADAKDEFIQQYAQRRIEEIQTAAEAVSTISHWKKIDEIAEAKRREYRTARAAIPEAGPAAPSIEAKGELRVSALFPPGSNPERYRLIDPSTSGDRTIAYVEFPEGSNIKINDFLNKFVGVRALERRVQTGGVNPIPIYIADDLVLLEPPGTSTPVSTTQTQTQTTIQSVVPQSTPTTIQPNP